jgi:isocitrate lyase
VRPPRRQGARADAQFIRTLVAARLAADVLGVPTLLVARTDAHSATLLTSDVDERDREFLTGERTAEGFFRVAAGSSGDRARPRVRAVRRPALVRDLDARPRRGARVRRGVHAKFPGKLLAYNCSPSFNWRQAARRRQIARFQKELGAMGYKFQFVTLAGFHALNASMFELARGYARRGMTAYVALQEREFALEEYGYTATRTSARSAPATSTDERRAAEEDRTSSAAHRFLRGLRVMLSSSLRA